MLERPARCEADERDAVAPGEHAPMAGSHRVVWWDPGALDLDREPEALEDDLAPDGTFEVEPLADRSGRREQLVGIH